MFDAKKIFSGKLGNLGKISSRPPKFARSYTYARTNPEKSNIGLQLLSYVFNKCDSKDKL